MSKQLDTSASISWGGGDSSDEEDASVQKPTFDDGFFDSFQTKTQISEQDASSSKEESKDRPRVLDIPEKGPFVAFVKNLDYSCTQTDLKEFLGELVYTDISIPFDRNENRIRGFAYITFPSAEGLTQFLSAHGSDFVAGRKLHIEVSIKDHATDQDFKNNKRNKRGKRNNNNRRNNNNNNNDNNNGEPSPGASKFLRGNNTEEGESSFSSSTPSDSRREDIFGEGKAREAQEDDGFTSVTSSNQRKNQKKNQKNNRNGNRNNNNNRNGNRNNRNNNEQKEGGEEEENAVSGGTRVVVRDRKRKIKGQKKMSKKAREEQRKEEEEHKKALESATSYNDLMKRKREEEKKKMKKKTTASRVGSNFDFLMSDSDEENSDYSGSESEGEEEENNSEEEQEEQEEGGEEEQGEEGEQGGEEEN